jgi:hypothetical protein
MMAHCILEFFLPLGCHVALFYKLLFGFSFRLLNLHFIAHDRLRYEASHLMDCICAKPLWQFLFFPLSACQYLWHPTSTDCGIAKPRAYSQDNYVTGHCSKT